MMPDSFPEICFAQKPIDKRDRIFILGSNVPVSPHEDVYIRIRRKEGHLLTDGQVIALPEKAPDPSFMKLWKMRKESSETVIKNLRAKNKKLTILELGCGNGWFSHALSQIPDSEVLGMDLNFTELNQASRLFSNKNLNFAFGDIEKDILVSESFDIITLNASIQYFQSAPNLLNTLVPLLKIQGEIHILDSPFHKSVADQKEARERSRIYFEKMGESEMMNHFHHLLWSEIETHNPEIHFFNRSRLKKILRIPQNPMPWIIIRS